MVMPLHTTGSIIHPEVETTTPEGSNPPSTLKWNNLRPLPEAYLDRDADRAAFMATLIMRAKLKGNTIHIQR
ncbi:hypothetical protein ACCT28_36435 [Rhizobium ruizarguesonis]